MPLSSNIITYEDVRKAMDQALASDKGVIITCPSNGMAVHLRQRCYKFRTLDARRNMEVYDKSDVAYGTSPYDCLQVDLVENLVYIRKRSIELDIQEIA